MLEGQLGDFSLPDIFQLIALTKKSGSLNISNSQRQGRILFKGGEVCFAVADVARVAIGARLVQAGLASEDKVIEILEARRAEGADGNLSQAILEAGEVDEGALDTFIRSSIEDAVFELMRLSEASFSFDAADEPDDTAGIAVATDHLVLEGGRRLGEWASIREHIPSNDAVLAVSPGAGEGDTVTMTGEQWRVLSLVDGRRTVGEVVDLSGKGEFTTAKLLSEMVTEGLIVVASSNTEGALGELFSRRDKLRRIEELELGKPVAPKAAPEPVVETPAKPEVVKPKPAPKATPKAVEVEEAPVAPEPPEPELKPAPDVSEALAKAVGGDGESSPAPAPKAEEVAANGNGNGNGNGKPAVDKSQVARELASLGLGDETAAVTKKPVPAPDAEEPEAVRRLTRDEDVNKGLLLRLIDGVKGA